MAGVKIVDPNYPEINHDLAFLTSKLPLPMVKTGTAWHKPPSDKRYPIYKTQSSLIGQYSS